MIPGIISLLLLVLLLIVFGTLAYGAWSAAPWVPLSGRDVERLLDLAELKPGELFYDLGCGDGRMLTAAARRGAQAVGFEIALVPYLLAHVRRLLSSERSLISIRYQNFWKVPLTGVKVVGCFLTPSAMARLEPKLAAELEVGARFVTYAFKLPNRPLTRTSKPTPDSTKIYCYQA